MHIIIVLLLDSENHTYTVEDAVEKLGFGTFQIVVTVFSGLMWVCISYSLDCYETLLYVVLPLSAIML